MIEIIITMVLGLIILYAMSKLYTEVYAVYRRRQIEEAIAKLATRGFDKILEEKNKTRAKTVAKRLPKLTTKMATPKVGKEVKAKKRIGKEIKPVDKKAKKTK